MQIKPFLVLKIMLISTTNASQLINKTKSKTVKYFLFTTNICIFSSRFLSCEIRTESMQ